MEYTNYDKVLKRTFFCPFCHKQVERINDYLAQYTVEKQLEIGLSNKRFHFAQHREQKRALEKAERLSKKFGRHSS